MVDFRYRVNGGAWTVVEGVTLPYNLSGILETDTVDVQPIGDTVTELGFDSNRIVEISQMTGARTAVVPQSYIDTQVADAFNPDNHSVGDPLVPTCAIYTHKALRSGNWSDPTMWDVGTTPHSAADGTAVVCSGEFDIVYDVLSNVRIKDIHVNGRGSLTFARNVQTRLWVDTIMVDGKLVMGEPGNPIPDSGIVTSGKRVPQCEVVFWQSEAPLKTSRLGLNTMGPVRIQGAAKANRLFATDTIPAGATTITLSEVPAGWKVGDEILIPSTEYGGTSTSDPQYLGPTAHYMGEGSGIGVFSANLFMINVQDEVRTITAIAGNTVTLNSALTFAHNRYTRTLPRGQVVDLFPAVAMLTHSIRFRTADGNDTAIWAGADLSVRQKRAHMMFMLHDDVQIRYAESKNMGRTDNDPSLADPGGIIRYASAGTSTPITDANNVRGRYPWHIHRTGAYFGRKQVVLKGVSAWAPPTEYPIPGWAITHHDSRAAVEDCVVFNVRGAGIVSELGNETGQWINNTVCWARGDGHKFDSFDQRSELWTNHNGHQGAAYENQARQILQHGNIATSSRTGWTYMQQTTNMLTRIPDGDSLRWRDPITQGGRANPGNDYNLDNATYGIEQAQIPDFFDNIAYGCLYGFWKAHQSQTDRHDKTPMIARGFHTINCRIAYEMINYTFVYYFYESLWIGDSQANAIGARLGTVSWENTFVNMRLERMATGFQDNGHAVGYQSYWLDIAFGTSTWGVTTPFSAVSNIDWGNDPTLEPSYGVMGPWTITGATTARPRTWAAITTASLPVTTPLAPYGPEQAVRDANPCPAYGSPPYVVVDGTSDLSMGPTGTFSINIKATIVDSMGYRRFGDYQSQETAHSVMSPKLSVGPEWATGTDIARRNGVFNDGGTWKTRLWFNDLDRATGDHFTYSIDVTLVGFDSGFLAANTVDPVATMPVVPLLLEDVPGTAIAAPATPVIVTSAAQSNTEGQLLAVVLRANTGLVRWAITGGADAADFEIAYVSNQWILRWAGNIAQDFETPNDADANNAYDVQVTCTSFAGLTASQNMTVTVTDVMDSIVDPFNDTFLRVAQNLEASSNWERVTGTAGAIRTVGAADGRIATPDVGATGNTIYLAPRTGSTKHFVQSRATQNFSQTRLILNYTDENNYISVSCHTANWWVFRRAGGVNTTIINGTGTYAFDDLMRVEWDGATDTLTIFRNGTSMWTGSVTGLPDSTRVGLMKTSTSNNVQSWRAFNCGSW